jgi:lipoprotein-anchoring transpeptidase ErfK/SrfK
LIARAAGHDAGRMPGARPTLLLALCLWAAGAAAGSDEPADLETMIARAGDDPDAVVPLLEAASERLITLPPARAAALSVRLEPFCRRAFLSSERLDDMADIGLVMHRVAPGETAAGIARRYHVTIDLLARLNQGFSAKNLQSGTRLKVLDLEDEPLELVVGCAEFRLLAWRDGVLVMSFPVGLGAAAHPTPQGATAVASCVRNPEWRDPDSGKVYQPGAAGNVLGGYWIGFAPGPEGAFRGIGIHGFTAEAPEGWLGRNGSHGCVRLRQGDIAALFSLVSPGTAVAIRP